MSNVKVPIFWPKRTIGAYYFFCRIKKAVEKVNFLRSPQHGSEARECLVCTAQMHGDKVSGQIDLTPHTEPHMVMPRMALLYSWAVAFYLAVSLFLYFQWLKSLINVSGKQKHYEQHYLQNVWLHLLSFTLFLCPLFHLPNTHLRTTWFAYNHVAIMGKSLRRWNINCTFIQASRIWN